MASYIDNIFQNARIQDVQAFTPDWNFLSQGQAQLSATQKKNFSDFAQRYNSIIDGELSRQDNVALRDAYKKQADEFVKQVSGLDLTDPRNVKAADAVFNPLVDNKMYIRDILNTRAVKDTYAKAQQYATSLNPAERDLYNEDSLKQLNYFLQDFKTASPEEALTMQAPGYTPGINLEKMALNFFNRQQYDVEVEQNTGQWIVKTKGGQLVEGNLRAGLMAEFVGDPLVRQNILLKNNMQKRDFVESNLMNYNGDKNAAEVAYYQQRYSGVLNQLERQGKRVSEEIDLEIEVANAVIKQLAKGENADNIPMSDEPLTVRERLVQTSEQLKRLQQGIKQENSQVIAAGTTKSKATSPYTVNIDGKTYTPEQLDSIIFQGEVSGMANRLAMSRFSQTMETNPYALEQWKSNLDWRNKENELLLKAQLDSQAAAALNASNVVDNPLPAQVEIKEDEAQKIFTQKEEQLNATALNTKSAENDLISYYINNFGGTDASVKGKSLADLTPIERSTIITKARGIKKAGASNAATHSTLNTKLKEYDNYSSIYSTLSNDYKTNLRQGITNLDINPTTKATLLRVLNQSGTDNIERLKAAYVPIRAAQIKEQKRQEDENRYRRGDYGLFGAVFSALVEGAGQAIGLIDTDEEDAAEEFDQIVTGNAEILTNTPSGFGRNLGSFTNYSVASQLYRDGKQKDEYGNLIGLGGIVPYSKNLGRATNTSNSVADVVLGNLSPKLSGAGVTFTTGEFNSNLDPENSKNYKPMSGQMANVIQVMTDAILQKQKETTGSLRGIGVQVYQRSPKDDLFLHIIPDENTAKLVTETSDKGKTSLTDAATTGSMISDGITVRIPAKNVPSGLIGFQKLSSTQQRFLVDGKVTIGGSDVSGDKGQLVITYNSTSDNFEVLGNRIENGKFVPVGDQIENHLNQSLRILQQKRNQGEVIDPYGEVIKIAENIYDGF